jgi:uncharacterized damage-inducible protein DinB
MLRPFEEYLDRLEELHAEMERSIEGLSLEALDWSPGPHMNALGVLVAHVTGAERYWVGDVVGCEPSTRNRQAEFRSRGVSALILASRLDEMLAYTCRVLNGLTLQDLATPRVSPRNGRGFTVAWALAHTLEHAAIHVGHAQITRQLWDQRRGASLSRDLPAQ